MTTLLWAVFPYLAIAAFVVGLIWRYRYDRFGWTTRSSQLYENKLLRIGSPLFHFGLLFAVVGHVMGLVIPKSWTDALGLDQHTYHLFAVVGGLIAGAMIVVGFCILVFRRRTVSSVFQATTWNDKLMYLVLGAVIASGIWNTISTTLSDAFNYRESVSPWFRSIFMFQPRPELMADAPLQFQIHGFLAFLLVLIWPFTRLVHAFSAPIGYLARPYIVYRSRSASGGRRHGAAPGSTWDQPGLTKTSTKSK